MKSAIILLAVSASLAAAQPAGSVEGTVIDLAARIGVPAATVTLFTPEGVRYQTRTGESGAFRLSGIDPGTYSVAIDKDGFVLFPPEGIRVEPGVLQHLNYEMQFAASKQSSVSGQVFDSRNRPLPFAYVDLIQGPDLRRRITADESGRFRFSDLDPGAYELRAVPRPGQAVAISAPDSRESGERVEEVATYYPSSIDEEGAQRVIVRGEATVKEFRTRAAPVVRVGGVVLDENGTPAAGIGVRLAPVVHQPPRVLAGFNSFFIAGDGGLGAGPEETYAATGTDGRFEFPSVRVGEWRIVARAEESGKAPRISGVTGVSVGARDISSLRIGLTGPSTIAGTAFWNVFCVSGRLACGRRPAGGTIFPIWFRAMDGQSSALNLGRVEPDGKLFFDNAPTGAFLMYPLPPIVAGQIVLGVHQQFGRPGELDPRLAPVALNATVSLSEGGSVILDDAHPANASARDFRTAISATVTGVVEGGAGAAVVLLPENYSTGSYGAFAYCQPDGRFEVRGLAAGGYYAMAVKGLDLEGLRDPELLRRLLTLGQKIRVDNLRRNSDIRIELSAWPE